MPKPVPKSESWTITRVNGYNNGYNDDWVQYIVINAPGDTNPITIGQTGGLISEITEEDEANARLIMASKDMLYALIDAYRFGKFSKDGLDEQILEIIAQAEGRS